MSAGSKTPKPYPVLVSPWGRSLPDRRNDVKKPVLPSLPWSTLTPGVLTMSWMIWLALASGKWDQTSARPPATMAAAGDEPLALPALVQPFFVR